jgi:hypothetical protein
MGSEGEFDACLEQWGHGDKQPGVEEKAEYRWFEPDGVECGLEMKIEGKGSDAKPWTCLKADAVEWALVNEGAVSICYDDLVHTGHGAGFAVISVSFQCGT